MPLPMITPVRSGDGNLPFEPGLGHRLVRGREGELGEQIVAPRLLAVDVLQRVEPLHLAGEAHRQLLRIELRDRRRAGCAGEQRGPGRFDVGPDGSHQPQAGDDDTVAPSYFPIFSWR